MKKLHYHWWLCILFFVSPTLHSSHDATLMFRAAYFHPSSDIVRQIYGNGIADLAFEGSKRISNHVHFWGAVDWLSKEGCSLCCSEKKPTSLLFVPISIGLNFMYPVTDYANVYIGAGPVVSYVRMHDKYPYVQQFVKDWNLGGVFKIGTHLEWRRVCLDFFIDYLSQRFKFCGCICNNVLRRDLSMSGVKFGAGIGFSF